MKEGDSSKIGGCKLGVGTGGGRGVVKGFSGSKILG